MSKLRHARFVVIAGSLVVAGGCASMALRPGGVKGLAFTACAAPQQRTAEGGGHVSLQICAERDAHRVGADNAGAGRIVAQIVNLDLEKRDARWQMEPGETYYVVVTRGSRYQIVGPGQVDNPNRSGRYIRCLPPHETPPTRPLAQWGTCETLGHSGGTAAGGTAPDKGGPSEKGGQSDALGPANLDPFNGPAWISCPTGCCTTEAI